MSMTNRLMAIAVTMKAYNSVLGVVVVSVLGLSAASAAQAALAPNATVTSDAVQGMRYTGGAGPNRITVITAPGDRFIVGDTAPITPGPGCTPATVGGGLFGVSCLAPRTANGQFRPFTVNAGGGDDVVNNSSTAAMRANGGPGNDTLNGGFLSDNLSDFNGRDILRGNAGNDALSTDFGPDDGLKDVLDGGSGDDVCGLGRDRTSCGAATGTTPCAAGSAQTGSTLGQGARMRSYTSRTPTRTSG